MCSFALHPNPSVAVATHLSARLSPSSPTCCPNSRAVQHCPHSPLALSLFVLAATRAAVQLSGVHSSCVCVHQRHTFRHALPQSSAHCARPHSRAAFCCCVFYSVLRACHSRRCYTWAPLSVETAFDARCTGWIFKISCIQRQRPSSITSCTHSIVLSTTNANILTSSPCCLLAVQPTLN